MFPPPEAKGIVRADAPDDDVAFSSRTDLEPNRCYEVEGRGTFYTNDQGRIVHVVADYGPKGALRTQTRTILRVTRPT